MTDLSQAVWRKARLSQYNGGGGGVAPHLPRGNAGPGRKTPAGGAHLARRGPVAVFLADARPGRHDLRALSDVH